MIFFFCTDPKKRPGKSIAMTPSRVFHMRWDEYARFYQTAHETLTHGRKKAKRVSIIHDPPLPSALPRPVVPHPLILHPLRLGLQPFQPSHLLLWHPEHLQPHRVEHVPDDGALLQRRVPQQRRDGLDLEFLMEEEMVSAEGSGRGALLRCGLARRWR